jgi:hypothetical protein
MPCTKIEIFGDFKTRKLFIHFIIPGELECKGEYIDGIPFTGIDHTRRLMKGDRTVFMIGWGWGEWSAWQRLIKSIIVNHYIKPQPLLNAIVHCFYCGPKETYDKYVDLQAEFIPAFLTRIMN